MSKQLITTQNQAVQTVSPSPLQMAGQIANKHAAGAVFADYLSRKSDNTIRTQKVALATFADFLTAAGVTMPDGKEITPDCLQHDPACWEGVTWGIVESFVKWQLSEGYAIATVNNRLSAVKMYCKLAAKAGAIEPGELQLIKAVSGYAGKEAKRVNERRDVTRRGSKKAEHVSMTSDQAKNLTDWMIHGDNPQGRRDCLLMCLLLEHGLRVGEVAALQVTDFDLKANPAELRFYRPKVDKVQTHRLTEKTYRAAVSYFEHDAPAMGRALLGSTKGGELTSQPMSERAITKRVAYLGLHLVGIYKEKQVKRAAGYVQTVQIGALSAHDCRHFWATDAARNGTDPFRLQEAGGWSSLVMPRRYVEDAKIANEGVKLSA